MYLRHTTVRKDGKTHTYWRLVRSVRRDGKVVQETVAQLGELDAEGRLSARRLARAMMGRGDQAELFEPPPREAWTLPVRLDQVRVERGRRFGDVWLGWMLWRGLKLDELARELLPGGRENVPWALSTLTRKRGNLNRSRGERERSTAAPHPRRASATSPQPCPGRVWGTEA